ncbi:TPA: toxin YdaT domain-containing protein [Escherichia coli]
MQTLTYQNDSDITQGVMINRAQARRGPSHEDIRDAVRSWAGADGQDVVTALIIEEYQAQGGDDITFPDDLCRKRQKLFRFLDNHFNSERYRENVRQLTPAILAVLPIVYRSRLLPEDNIMARLARMEKETSEAKIAVAMNAPRHQKLKELSEGIVEMYRVDPGLTGPLMEMVQMMLGVGMTGSKMAKAAVLEHQRL